LAGFRNCLAEYTVHSLSPCFGLLTALVLKEFFQGGTSGFFQTFFCGGPNVEKFVSYHSILRKQRFLLKFSNSCPSSDIHMLVCRKSSCHTIKNFG